MKCFGSNPDGQLGATQEGPLIETADPVNLGSSFGAVVGLRAGTNHNCALNATGFTKCWGANYRGPLTIVSQPQSITQKGVHAHPLTARERELWVFAAFEPFS